MTFTYDGYGSYDALFVLALGVLVVLALAPLLWRRIQRRRESSPEEVAS